MSYSIDISPFERVLGGDYIKYCSVNNASCPVNPFGITRKPFILPKAKKALKLAVKSDSSQKHCGEEAKLHISFFDGYQHTNPSYDHDLQVQVKGGSHE